METWSQISILLSIFLAICGGQQTAIITGGFNGYQGARTECELLNKACLVPSFPSVSNETGGSGRPDRSDHITEVTEDGLVLACGGEAADGTDDLSCLALDVAGGQWAQHSVLNVARLKATSVAVPGVGIFVIGGFKELSTELLPVGGDTWTWGPTLPGTLEETSYFGICSILYSETEFMVIGGDGEGMFGGTRVSVYSVETGEWELWSDLSQNIWGHSCARLDNMVVVAGGVNLAFQIIPTTYILDLDTREERVVGDLLGARAWFGMATIDARVLAFGGMDPLKTEGQDSLSDIQELDQATWEWRRLDEGLAETRGISSLGSAVVMVDQVCP